MPAAPGGSSGLIWLARPGLIWLARQVSSRAAKLTMGGHAERQRRSRTLQGVHDHPVRYVRGPVREELPVVRVFRVQLHLRSERHRTKEQAGGGNVNSNEIASARELSFMTSAS